MSTKTEIGDERLYLFWSLLKIPNSPLSWEIESKKIWLKQPKAASALDFSYFQRVSKLVTHDNKVLKSQDFRTFLCVLKKFNVGMKYIRKGEGLADST